MEAERYDKYFAKYSAASLKTNVRPLGIGGAVGSVDWAHLFSFSFSLFLFSFTSHRAASGC